MRQAGFTLLELLAGLVVLGFILGGLSQGVRFGLRAADTQARLGEGRGELDAVDRALRRLVTEAGPGTTHDGPSLHGSSGRLALVSALPQAALAGGAADIAIGVDGGRLLLRWTPHLHARRLGPAPAPQETELLRGLARLELGYQAADGSGGWRPAWDEDGLPALVRLRLVFPPGDPRHWPDIVAAPQRKRAE